MDLGISLIWSHHANILQSVIFVTSRDLSIHANNQLVYLSWLYLSPAVLEHEVSTKLIPQQNQDQFEVIL